MGGLQSSSIWTCVRVRRRYLWGEWGRCAFVRASRRWRGGRARAPRRPPQARTTCKAPSSSVLTRAGRAVSGPQPTQAIRFEAVAINSDDRRLLQYIAKAPRESGRCINLRALDASNNDLAELPCSLGTFPKLQRIALDGNPLRSVRRDVIERGCEAIKAFLRTRAATPAEKTSEDDFDPLALANRVRDPVCVGVFFTESPSRYIAQDARGVLNLAGKHLRHWPLDRDVCAKVREILEQGRRIRRVTWRTPKSDADGAREGCRRVGERLVGIAGGVVSAGSG